jgi:hypothetical protein
MRNKATESQSHREEKKESWVETEMERKNAAAVSSALRPSLSPTLRLCVSVA